MQASAWEWTLTVFVGVGIVALWLWALSLALQVPQERWDEAGLSKPLWIFLIVVLSVPGAALYLVLVAPSLSPQSE